MIDRPRRQVRNALNVLFNRGEVFRHGVQRHHIRYQLRSNEIWKGHPLTIPWLRPSGMKLLEDMRNVERDHVGGAALRDEG